MRGAPEGQEYRWGGAQVEGGTCGEGVPVGDGSREAVASVGEVTCWGGVHVGESTAPNAIRAPRSWDPSECLQAADSDLPPSYCLFQTIPLINNVNCVSRSCSITQLCPTLCDPVDCSPPGSSVHGILQVRILEWVARPSSRGSS